MDTKQSGNSESCGEGLSITKADKMWPFDAI